MWQQRCGSESAEGHTGIPSTAALTDMKITSRGRGPVHKAVTASSVQGHHWDRKGEFSSAREQFCVVHSALALTDYIFKYLSSDVNK